VDHHRPRARRAALVALLVVATCSWAALAALAQHTGAWRVARTRDGIVAGVLERAGKPLPLLRAEGIVEAGLYHVAAVLKDADNHHRWMPHTSDSALVERVHDFEIIVYNRSAAPWPVSDRDVVVRSVATYYAAHGELHNHFSNVADARRPPLDGVVRMPRLSGLHRLRALDPQRTHVTVEIDADPGGGLPSWLVRLVSDNLAIDTIRALRKRAEETRGHYEAQIAEWTARHGVVVARPERAALGTLHAPAPH